MKMKRKRKLKSSKRANAFYVFVMYCIFVACVFYEIQDKENSSIREPEIKWKKNYKQLKIQNSWTISVNQYKINHLFMSFMKNLARRISE